MNFSKWSFLKLCAVFIILKSGQSFAEVGTIPTVADLTKACFESTCGNDYVLNHPFKTSVQTYLDHTTLVEKNLHRPIELFMGRIIHQSVLTNEIYQKLATFKVSPLDESTKGFILSMLYIQKMDKYLSTITVDSKGRVTFDRAKLKALPENLSDAEINAISTFKDLIPIFTTQMSIINQLTYVQILKMFYPQKTILQASQLEAQATLAVYERLAAIVPGLKVFTSYDVVLNRAAAGNILSQAEMIYLKKQISSRVFLDVLIQPQIQAEFQKLPLDFQQMIQKQFKVYQESTLAKAVQNPKSIKKILKDSIRECSSYLAYSYAALPTLKQIEYFKTILRQIELTAQQMLEEKTKSSLAGKFNFEFNLPPVKDQVLTQWTTFLRQATVETEKRITVLKELNLAESKVQAAAYLMMETDSGREIFDSVSSFCQQTAPSFLDDAMLTADNSIHLSWPTIVYPEVGAAVIAHEVGHVIQKKWPTAILKENACLVAKQNSSDYLKEDFADLFSAELLRRMNGQLVGLPIKNLGCGLVPPTGDRGQLFLKNKEKKDPHSSELYRILSTSAVRKNMTKECSAFLKAEKVTLFDQYCQWEK